METIGSPFRLSIVFRVNTTRSQFISIDRLYSVEMVHLHGTCNSRFNSTHGIHSASLVGTTFQSEQISIGKYHLKTIGHVIYLILFLPFYSVSIPSFFNSLTGKKKRKNECNEIRGRERENVKDETVAEATAASLEHGMPMYNGDFILRSRPNSNCSFTLLLR